MANVQKVYVLPRQKDLTLEIIYKGRTIDQFTYKTLGAYLLAKQAFKRLGPEIYALLAVEVAARVNEIEDYHRG